MHLPSSTYQKSKAGMGIINPESPIDIYAIFISLYCHPIIFVVSISLSIHELILFGHPSILYFHFYSPISIGTEGIADKKCKA